MFETLEEKTEEKAMVQFLERFTDYPFLVKFKNSEYHIGEGEPTFTVNFTKHLIIFLDRWVNFQPTNQP